MIDPEDISAWLRMDDRLTTSGQPSETQLGALKALGVETVINLGLHSHPQAIADEAGSLAALGIDYIYIPVAFDAPREADFERFCVAMAAAQGNVLHVHCIMNLRVSAFIYRYRRDVLHHDASEARAMMHRIWQPAGIWAAFVGAPV